MFFNIIICLLIADFITGFFHWLEDTYGVPGDSWLSRNIWEPNILHHKSPSLMGMTNFIARNYIQWIAAFVVVTVIYMLGYGSWQLIFIGIVASFANEVHKWNHSAKNNWIIELLQDMCLIQTKLHHAKHHLKPYNRNYCILTNWLNPVLELVYFWRALEFLLSPLITVKRGLPSRNGY